MPEILKTVLGKLSAYGPLMFAFGFMAPLIASILERTSAPLPFDLTPLLAGLILGGLYGLYAQIRGTWLW